MYGLVIQIPFTTPFQVDTLSSLEYYLSKRLKGLVASYDTPLGLFYKLKKKVQETSPSSMLVTPDMHLLDIRAVRAYLMPPLGMVV